MNLSTLLGPLTGALGQIAVVGALILATALVLGGLLVYRVGAAKALSFFRGEGKFIQGEYFSQDVYSDAMHDLHRQKRKGVLLDAEANAALREYQYGSGRKRSRFGW